MTPAAPALPADLQTPGYCFDPAVVADDLRDLRQALGTPVLASVKASPVLDLLVRCAPALADGIEIASLGELNLTIGRLGVPRYVNTPAMDGLLIAAALACRATLVADHPQQIALIEAALHKPALQQRPREGIVLRINAASLIGRGGPQADHFGMDLDTLQQQLARLRRNTVGPQAIGLHVFAGSHSFATGGVELVRHLTALVAQVRQQDPALEQVLIGAGLGADWREAGPDFAAYRSSLRALQAQVRVLHEAGRAVFSRSGTFATRIVAVKPLSGESVLVCDGGLAHCFALAQTEQFVKRWREPRLVKARPAPPAADAAPRTHKVVGSSCSRADVLGRLTCTATPEPGDLLLFDHCGAYHSYSPTGFLNLRPARRYVAS